MGCVKHAGVLCAERAVRPLPAGAAVPRLEGGEQWTTIVRAENRPILPLTLPAAGTRRCHNGTAPLSPTLEPMTAEA